MTRQKYNQDELRKLWQAFTKGRLGPEAQQRIKSVLLAEAQKTAVVGDAEHSDKKSSLLNKLTLQPMIPIIITVILMISGVGTAVAADQAKPGDILYGLDRGLELTRLNFTLTGTGKAKLLVKLAEEREHEQLELQQENKTTETDQASQNTNQALQNALQVINRVQEEHQAKDSGRSAEALSEVEEKLTELQQRFTEREQERVKNKLENQLGSVGLEATVKNGRTHIKAEVGDQKFNYIIDSTDTESIINSLHQQTGLSTNDIAAILKIETEQEDEDEPSTNSASPDDNDQPKDEENDELNGANINTNAALNLNLNSNLSNRGQNNQNIESDDDSSDDSRESEQNDNSDSNQESSADDSPDEESDN